MSTENLGSTGEEINRLNFTQGRIVPVERIGPDKYIVGQIGKGYRIVLGDSLTTVVPASLKKA